MSVMLYTYISLEILRYFQWRFWGLYIMGPHALELSEEFE